MKDGLENIDEVIKQAFDGFEANVDPSVWTNIQNGINAGSTGGSAQADPVSSIATSTGVKAVVVKIAAAVIAVGTIATATYYIATSPKDKVVVENVVDNTEKNVIVEEQIETEEPITNKVENIETVGNNTSTEEEVVEEKITPIVEENEPENNITNVGNNENNSNVSNVEKPSQNNPEKITPTPSPNKKSTPPVETKPTPKVEIDEPVKEPTTPKVDKPVKKEADVNTIPNAFSPNGDGQNDVIKITGENLEKLEVVVMDKTGKIVYKMTNIEQEWNGKDQNGFDLIRGTYYIAGVVVDIDGNSKNIKQAVNLFK